MSGSNSTCQNICPSIMLYPHAYPLWLEAGLYLAILVWCAVLIKWKSIPSNPFTFRNAFLTLQFLLTAFRASVLIVNHLTWIFSPAFSMS
eukprot:m.480812 g.480812  ORF g.480812 m.480812 type:complete len:90 (+) comp57179_c0_seq6:116-385(+)